MEEIFIFEASFLQFGDLLGGWKLATNANFSTISPKLRQQSQNTLGHGV